MTRGRGGSEVEKGRRVVILWSLWLHNNDIIFRRRLSLVEAVTQDEDNLVAF